MPEPARMQIAKGLKSLRDRTGRTLADVSARSSYGKSTVSRYEDAFSRHKIVPRTVRLLAEAAGGEPGEVAALVRLADSGQPQWWADDDVAPTLNPLLSLESTADTECVVAPSLVPGLLQTEAYARSVHEAEHTRQNDDVITGMVTARMTRQRVLRERESGGPLHLWAVLHEAVLRNVVGGRSGMREQVDHLIAAAQQPNVDIQVLPFDSGASAAGTGHFVQLEAGDATAVYIELLGGGLYVSAPDEVGMYRVAFDYLRCQSASTTRSLEILKNAREEYTS